MNEDEQSELRASLGVLAEVERRTAARASASGTSTAAECSSTSAG